jgi:CubicO group peptidase (beta-lactamase class C family)
MARRRDLFLLVGLVIGLGAVPDATWAQRRPPARPHPLAGFDQYALAAMRQWKVPGMAIAAVRGDSIVLAKGYGVRTLGDPTPVDAHTLFAIGSASKAFTGAALGMLADEGKVSFDGRVTDYLPSFELADPWLTRDLRVRDLLVHRSGFSRGDNLFYGTTVSRADIVRALRHAVPTAPFRTKFQYNNLMYITAGEVIREVTRMSWDDFIKTRLFAPLEMTASNTSVLDLVGQPNVATPHAELGGVVTPIAWRNIDNAAASGSINSNVLDMTKWLRLWLHGGRFEGRRLLSEAVARDAITPQFTIDDPLFYARLMAPNFLSYGYGWFVQDFRGRRWVGHGGNIDGMAALVGFLPSDSVGVVILTNMNQSDVTLPLVAHLFDRLLGISPPRDYNAEYKKAADEFEAKQRAGRRPPVRVAGTQPTLPLSAYVGDYRQDFMGLASVSLGSKGTLAIRYHPAPTVAGELEHWHYDSFVAKLQDPIFGEARVTFRVGSDGRVAGMVFSHGGSAEWVKQ